MSVQPPQSFTIKYNARMGVLWSEAHIAQAFHVSSAKSLDPKSHNAIQFKAIWDTGATNTVVTRKVVDDCGLKPIGVAIVNTASGQHVTQVYFVSIFLPNKVCIAQLRVTEGVVSSDAEILVGMDIIARGDFAVTHGNGKTTVSFRMPSVECIDFVEASKLSSQRIVPRKVGRNAPCPCGSGKKYKKCCGK